jgi:hypothetical protein
VLSGRVSKLISEEISVIPLFPVPRSRLQILDGSCDRVALGATSDDGTFGLQAYLRIGRQRSGRAFEYQADPRMFTPDNAATLAHIAGGDIECEAMRNDGVVYVKARSSHGQISDHAVDSGAVELNQSGLKNPLS